MGHPTVNARRTGPPAGSDNARHQSSTIAIASFARAAAPRAGDQPHDHCEVAEAGGCRGYRDRADGVAVCGAHRDGRGHDRCKVLSQTLVLWPSAGFVDPKTGSCPRNRRVNLARRQFTHEFQIEAVRRVTDRGVAMAQAARDLDLAESVLRRWMQELTATPATAFHGNGQMRSDPAGIAALKRKAGRLRAERDNLATAATFSRARRHEVRRHRQAAQYLARQQALRCAGGLAFRLPRLAQPPDLHSRDPGAKLVTTMQSFVSSLKTERAARKVCRTCDGA